MSTLPARLSAQNAAPRIQMWSNDGCGCCDLWAKHLQNARFDVVQHKVDDVAGMRKKLRMPEKYAGCHVASVGRYAIDGHVPAIDILRLLREQPSVIGLAVPDMPTGSPGMERAGQIDPYQVLLIGLNGSATVYKSYP